MKRAFSDGGFTLLELTISMAILVVVTMLTFLAIQSSTSIARVSVAKEIAQTSVRDALSAVTAELQLASKISNNALVPPLAAVQTPRPGQIVFQVPQNASGTVWSTPITFTFVNEDTTVPGSENNARLDDGEDEDGDGVLSRRIIRTQGNETSMVGGVNNLSSVLFQINATSDVVTVTMTSTVMLERRPDAAKETRPEVITATATSNVYLVN